MGSQGMPHSKLDLRFSLHVFILKNNFENIDKQAGAELGEA